MEAWWIQGERARQLQCYEGNSEGEPLTLWHNSNSAYATWRLKSWIALTSDRRESVVYSFGHDVICKHGDVIGQYDTENRHWALLKTETPRAFQTTQAKELTLQTDVRDAWNDAALCWISLSTDSEAQNAPLMRTIVSKVPTESRNGDQGMI